ncbi:MAG: GNAT family N-acetyltransferase [Methanosphaera sp.]|nr:GNAT family N-acetyltransferase [Methanosphaera sp.]
MIRLLNPDMEYMEAISDFKEEFIIHGEEDIPGGELMDRTDSITQWIEYVNNNRDKNTLAAGWVVSDTFIAVDEVDNVVGVIVLRHELNDFLKDFGHIGFSVRPSERGKGIATYMLRKVLEVARKINLSQLQLSCMDDNIPSKKIILANGGIHHRSFKYNDEPASVYIIKLEK